MRWFAFIRRLFDSKNSNLDGTRFTGFRTPRNSKVPTDLLALETQKQEMLSRVEVLANQKQFQMAHQILEEAVRQHPQSAEVFLAFGNTLALQQDFRGAKATYCTALELNPLSVLIHYNLGNTLRKLGELHTAIYHLQKSIEIDANFSVAHHALGLCFSALNDRCSASAEFRASLSINPQYMDSLRELLRPYLNRKDVSIAESILFEFASENEKSGTFKGFQGLLYYLRGDLIQAKEILSTALSLDPRNGEILDSLGMTLHELGQINEALSCYDQAICLNPNASSTYVHRALAHLESGNFLQGWTDYERRHNPDETILNPMPPLWDGCKSESTNLLIFREQGIGDEILFAAYIPHVSQRVKNCILYCAPKLERLFARSFPNVRVVSSVENIPDERPTCAVAIGSLPRHFPNVLLGSSTRTPYLRADSNRTSYWMTKLKSLGPGPKVGISWRGGTLETNKSRRSLTLDALLPILRISGVQFVSLQYTDCLGEVENFSATNSIQLTHWQDAIDDYHETAALVQSLDLVVSVCTSIVSLANALAKPVWVLVPKRAGWMYGRHGVETIWFPSARLFRQEKHMEWEPVIASVANALLQYQISPDSECIISKDNFAVQSASSLISLSNS